jgi:hypothetical protein
MSYDTLSTTLAFPVGAGGSISFAYPSGRNADSYRSNGAVLTDSAGTVTRQEQEVFSVIYGASSITVAYGAGPMVAAGSASLKVPLSVEAEVLSGASSSSGVFRNFKQTNTRRLRRVLSNVRSGVANDVIAVLGDSLNAGHGSGTGTNGFTGARALTPSRRMAEILNKGVVAAQEIGIFGSAGAGAEYANYDSRVSLGSGWATTSAGPGGGYYDNSTTLNALAFTPTQSFDTIVFWYGQASGYATFTVDVDGGAALATVNAANATGAMIKQTVSCTLGTHTINFKRTGTGTFARIMGVTVYNSASKVLDIWNLGIAGATVATLNQTANPWSPRNAYVAMAASTYLLDIGMNDWIGGTSLTQFAADYEALVVALLTQSDVIIVNPSPRAVAGTPLATQLLYASIIDGIAQKYDLPFIDLRAYFETQETANALGEYYDITHPNSIGYALKGDLFAKALTQV